MAARARPHLRRVQRSHSPSVTRRPYRLAALAALASKRAHDGGVGRWLTFGLFVGSGAIAVAASMIHVRSADVEILLNTHSVSFDTASDVILTRYFGGRTLSYEGVTSGIADNCENVTFRTEGAAWPTVKPLEVPSGTTVALSLADDAELELDLSTPKHAALATTVTLPAHTEVSGCVDRIEATSTAPEVTATHGALTVHTVASAGESILQRLLPVTSLDFAHTEQPRELAYRRVSDVVNGSIYLEDLDTKRDIREGQLLRIGVQRGEVELVTATDKLLTIRFRGVLSSLDVRRGSSWASLLPTQLESWSHRQSLAVVYAGLTWLFSALVAVLRWSRSGT